MKLYRSVLPESSMMEVVYEDLVSDRDRVIRSIVDFLELPWDDKCLHFEAISRTVRTPSAWQVRQPVYTDFGWQMETLRALAGGFCGVASSSESVRAA